MALFEKKPDAPSGTVVITVDNVTTVFEDAVQVDVTDPDTVQYLLTGSSRYIQLVDGQDPWVPPRPAKYPVYSSGLPEDGDGMFYDEQNNEWRPSPVATQAQIATKADLIGGKIVSSQIPDMAISKTNVVANRTEMLQLDAQEGDVAVVTEDTDGETRTYILSEGDATSFGSWVELSSPGNVTSVNGSVGVVNLGAGDVGAMAALGPGAQSRVPITSSSGSETSVPVGTTLINNGIVQRTGSGQAVVADGSAASHAATKGQLDTAIAGAIPALGPGTGSRVPRYDQTGALVVTAVGQGQATAGSFVLRTAGGQAVVADAVNPNEAVTKGQADKPSTLGVSGTGVRLPAKSPAGDSWQAGGVWLSTAATPSTAAHRTGSGQLKAAAAVESDDLTTKSQIDTKLDSNTAAPSRLYAVNAAGANVMFPYTNANTGSTAMFRDAGGRAQVTDGASGQDIATVGQLNGRLSAAQRTAINALNPATATVADVVNALKAS